MSLTVNPGTITAKLRLAPNFSLDTSTQKEVATCIQDRLKQLDIQNILKESSTPPKKDKFKVTVLRDGTILKSQEGTKTQRLGTMDATALFNKLHFNQMPSSSSSDSDSYEVHTSPPKPDAQATTDPKDTDTLTLTQPLLDDPSSSYAVHTSPGRMVNSDSLEILTSPTDPINSTIVHTSPSNQSRRGQSHDNGSTFDDGHPHQQGSYTVSTSPLDGSNQPQTFTTIQTSPSNQSRRGQSHDSSSTFDDSHHHQQESLIVNTSPLDRSNRLPTFSTSHTNPFNTTWLQNPAHPQFPCNTTNTLTLQPSPHLNTVQPDVNRKSVHQRSNRQDSRDHRGDSQHHGFSDSNGDTTFQPCDDQMYAQYLRRPTTKSVPQVSTHLSYGNHHPLLTTYFNIMMDRSSSEELLFLLQKSFDAFNKGLINKETLINFLNAIDKSNKDQAAFIQLETKLNQAITKSVISMYSECRETLNTDKEHLSDLENLMLELLNLLFEAHESKAISSETLAEHLLHVKNCTTANFSDEEIANLLISLLNELTTINLSTDSTFINTPISTKPPTKDASIQTSLSAPPYRHPPSYHQLEASNAFAHTHAASEQPMSKSARQDYLMGIISSIDDVPTYNDLSAYITQQLETSEQSFAALKNTVIAKVRAHFTTISQTPMHRLDIAASTQTDSRTGSKPSRDNFRSIDFHLPDDENGFVNYYLRMLKNPQQLVNSDENRLLLDLLQKLFNAYNQGFIPALILFNLLTTMSRLDINEENFTYLNDALIDEISKTIILRKALSTPFKEEQDIAIQTDDEPTTTSSIHSDVSDDMTMYSFSPIRSLLTTPTEFESDTSSTTSRFSTPLPFNVNTQQAASTQTDTASEASISKEQMKDFLLGLIAVIEHQQLHNSLYLYIDNALKADNPNFEQLHTRIIQEIHNYYNRPLSHKEHIRALTNIIAPIAHLPGEYATLSTIIKTELRQRNVDFEELERSISERVTTIVKGRTNPKVSRTQETQTHDTTTTTTSAISASPHDIHARYTQDGTQDGSHTFANEEEHRAYLAKLAPTLTSLEQARQLYSELKQQAKQGSISHEKKYYLDLYKFLDTPVPEGLAHVPNLLLDMIESTPLDTEKQRSDFLSHMHTTYPSYYGIKSPQSQEKPLSSKPITKPTGIDTETQTDESPAAIVSQPVFAKDVSSMNSKWAIKFNILDGRSPKIINYEYCLLQYMKNPNTITRLTISQEILGHLKKKGISIDLKNNKLEDEKLNAEIFTELSAKYPDYFPIKPSDS